MPVKETLFAVVSRFRRIETEINNHNMEMFRGEVEKYLSYKIIPVYMSRVQGAAWKGQEQGKSKGTPERQGAVAMSKIIDGIVKDLKAIPETLKAKTAGVDKKKLILMNLPYILAGYFCDKIAWLWRVSPGSNVSDKMMAAMNGMNDLFSNPLPSFFPKDLLVGIVVYFKAKNAKKFRQGVEYGSARWSA